MSQPVLLLLLLSVSTFLPKSMAQEPVVGVDTCACAPGSYTFKLNLAKSCEDFNIAVGPGIERTTCGNLSALTIDGSVDDFEFDEITSIAISEARGFGQEINRIEGPFSDGDTFTFNSITSSDPNLDTSSIPASFTLSISGTNTSGQRIGNVGSVIFTNDCGTFPVLDIGDQFGMVEVVDATAGLVEYCPIAAPTPSPTLAPTTSPTGRPTTNPTQTPTRMPTVPPTSTPTLTPTQAPTRVPTMLPTKEPTVSPTAGSSPTRPKKRPSSNCRQRIFPCQFGF